MVAAVINFSQTQEQVSNPVFIRRSITVGPKRRISASTKADQPNQASKPGRFWTRFLNTLLNGLAVPNA